MEQMHLLHLLGETEQAIDEVRGYGLEESGEPMNGNPRPS